MTVAVGWWLSERTPEGAEYTPRGGIVVDISEAAHPDTGEAVTTYVLVRSWKGHISWLTLRADQVAAPTDDNLPNSRTIRSVCKTAAAVIAKRGANDVDDLQLFSLGCRLLAAIAPQRRTN